MEEKEETMITSEDVIDGTKVANEEEMTLINKPKSLWQCNSCWEVFQNVEEQKVHFKSDWHRYNLRRKASGMNPVPHLLFEKKLEQLRNTVSAEKGKAHLKKKVLQQDYVNNNFILKQSTSQNDQEKSEQCIKISHCSPLTGYELSTSFFDNVQFESIDESLEYMKKKYSFFIPDEEYLKDKEGLIKYLGNKIYKYYKCIYCDKRFSSTLAVQHHMCAKGHTYIGQHLNTERFFDYSQSYVQLIRETSKKKKEKLLEILSKVKPKVEKEIKTRSIVDYEYSSEDDVASTIILNEDDEWEDLGDEMYNLKNENKKNLDDEINKITVTHEKAALILDFLGLKKAEITDTGNLRLSSGLELIHRDVAYIYKQKVPIRSQNDFNNINSITDNSKNQQSLSYEKSNGIKFKKTKDYRLANFHKFQLLLGMKANSLQRCIKKKTKYFL